MAHEQSKAAKRRYNIGDFHSKYFKGVGLDIGAGNDSLANNIYMFPGIRRVKAWDLENGDAQYLASLGDNEYDFAHASHCLEHMVDWKIALENWIRVVKSGGFLVITIPEEYMYEHMMWPSRFNSDHKWSFTMRPTSEMPKSVHVLDLAKAVNHIATVEKIEVITEFFNPQIGTNYDQTLLPNAECCIEIILRKI